MDVEDEVSFQGRYTGKYPKILNTKKVKLSFALGADSHEVNMQSGLN